MNPLIENLFDHLGDGVIVIADDQRVKFSNRAAQDLMNALPGARLGNQIIGSLLNEVAGGHVRLPIELPANFDSLNRSDKLRTWLMHSPVKNEFVIIVRDFSQQEQASKALGNLRLLLNNACRDKLDHFLVTMQAILAETRSAGYAMPELETLAGESVKHGKSLLDALQLLFDWAHIEKNADVIGSDRVHPIELLEIVLDDLRPLARENHIALSVDTKSCAPTVLYGSRVWFIRSISEFVRFAILNSREFSQLEISLQKNKSSFQIVIRNPELSIQASHRGLLAQHGYSTDDTDFSTLSLLLSKLIVEAYGGSAGLMFVSGAEQLFLQFPLSAPGARLRNATQEQCELLAQDIANLMKRGAHPSFNPNS